MRYRIGVVAVAFAPAGIAESAERARALGFEHLDCAAGPLDALAEEERDALVLPIGDVFGVTASRPRATTLAPVERRGEDRFDDAVALFRSMPGVRMEPGPHTAAGSIEKIEALVAAVPGLRLTLDTGHVAYWGEDPVRALRYADHVQLRQSAKGDAQRHADEGGDVDFSAVLRELDRLDYQGLLSVEYFDLPSFGWPLEDPVGYSVALAAHVRGLMRAA